MAVSETKRSSYHHGDLPNALVAAAVGLARQGGPEAVVLREAARKVGVSATAAYRHFAGYGELLHAIKLRCQDGLAAAMRAEIDALPDRDDPVARLRALAAGYLRYATTEPGLFATAFCRGDAAEPPFDFADAPAFQMLSEALDQLVARGRMPAERRPMAEMPLWASVHGLAVLTTDGPLGRLSEQQRAAALDRTTATLLDGLLG